MRIRNTGKVCDHVWYLGRVDSGIYLVEGANESMIVSGGSSYIIPDILEQLGDFCIDEESITKLLILHTHFDHIGTIPFFKHRNPSLELFASARAWEILNNPKIVDITNEFSRQTTATVGMTEACDPYDTEWRDDLSGTTIGDGYRFDLGGIEVEIYETPGHSPCSLSAYIPQLRVLFPSDSAGIPFEDTIIVMGNSNYTLYQRSLEKLAPFDVDYLCSDHYGYIDGEEAKHFIAASIATADRCRALIEKTYTQTKDLETTAGTVYNAHYSGNLFSSLSPEIIRQVCRQMVKHVVKELENNA